MTLVSEKTTVAPGKTVWVAVNYQIEKAWHIYSDSPNDTGAAPVLRWKLPAEMCMWGEVLWPTPVRHISPGDALDYVYESHATLLIEFKVRDSARPGEDAVLSLDSTVVVCDKVCLMEKQHAELKVHVGEEQTDPSSTVQTLFREARAALPKPIQDCKGVTGRVSAEGKVVIEAPGAESVAFLPWTNCAPIEDLMHNGETKGERLSLKAETLDERKQPQMLYGTVAVRWRDGNPPTYASVKRPVMPRNDMMSPEPLTYRTAW